MHIPRTGGGSIAHLLKQRYQSGKVSSPTVPRTINYECLYGHFNYTENGHDWVTFLRAPYDRLQSYYAYMLTLNPKLTQVEFFTNVGANAMCKQLGCDNSTAAIKILNTFWFVGRFIEDIPKFCKLIGVTTNLRHTHKSKLYPNLTLPDGFIDEDIKVWQHYFE